MLRTKVILCFRILPLGGGQPGAVLCICLTLDPG